MINRLRKCCIIPALYALTAALWAQTFPEWVEEIPQDDDYYWARENVGTRDLSEEEYKARANAQALHTISIHIRATVSGEAQSSFKETRTESDDK